MAYLMTAVMSGGVSALLSLISGETTGQILWNYVLFGHLGMATLALASITFAQFDRRKAD
jgi:hypothetical protein